MDSESEEELRYLERETIDLWEAIENIKHELVSLNASFLRLIEEVTKEK